MITELLFVLSGHSSPVLCSKNLQSGLLHPGEAKLLSNLLPLGEYANDCQKFVDNFSLANSLKFCLNDSFAEFRYKTAFAEGVKTVLCEYRSNLVSLEAKFKISPQTRNLTTVHSTLMEYNFLFPALKDAIDKIVADDSCYKGCLLLNLIEEHSSIANPIVERSFEKIRRICCRILCTQLVGWLKFGVVNDGRNEFFIQTFDNEHVLRSDMCPKFISPNLRDKIYFIGSKISLIDKQNKTSILSVFDENCLKIEQRLTNEEFDAAKLESPIENIRKCLSEKLWLEIVAKGNDDELNLFVCLDFVKDYYFLGKGELFTTLIDEIDRKNVNSLDFDKILQNAFLKLYGVDKLSAVLGNYFTMKFRKFDDPSSILRWQDYLEMTFNLSSLLKQVFTENSLNQCTTIFRFLLKIRRVQTNLNKTWLLLLKNRRIRASNNFVLECKIWRVDNLMLFLVNNLQYYLHVDVLDSAWKTLLNVLTSKNSQEIQMASQSFAEFVRKIGLSCFLESREISKLIDGLLNDCQKFTDLFSFSSENQEELEFSNLAEKIQEIFVSYERHASLLFRILSNPKMHLTNTNLSQLLQRLDFNSYFSSTRLF